MFAARRDNDWEDRLAERARLSKLDKAPFAVEPIGGEDQDDGVGAVDLLIKLPFPVCSGRNAGVLVDIEKDAFEALVGEPCLDVGGDSIVAAGMGEKNPGHE